jgi:hypothetical protein
MSRPLLIAVLLTLATPAAAQDVQRCQGADGKVSYANGACPHGTTAVRTLPPAGAPSAADQMAARQRAQQDLRSAAALDRARKADEERADRERQQAMAKAQKLQTQCRRLLTSLLHAQEDLAAARPQKRTEAQRRLARAEDLYRDDCGSLKQ